MTETAYWTCGKVGDTDRGNWKGRRETMGDEEGYMERGKQRQQTGVIKRERVSGRGKVAGVKAKT